MCIAEAAREFEEAESRSKAGQSASSAPGTSKVDQKGFVFRVASKLSISVKEESDDSEFKSYVADHMLTPKESRQFNLPRWRVLVCMFLK